MMEMSNKDYTLTAFCRVSFGTNIPFGTLPNQQTKTRESTLQATETQKVCERHIHAMLSNTSQQSSVAGHSWQNVTHSLSRKGCMHSVVYWTLANDSYSASVCHTGAWASLRESGIVNFIFKHKKTIPDDVFALCYASVYGSCMIKAWMAHSVHCDECKTMPA